jgi:hypothetical protein
VDGSPVAQRLSEMFYARHLLKPESRNRRLGRAEEFMTLDSTHGTGIRQWLGKLRRNWFNLKRELIACLALLEAQMVREELHKRLSRRPD